MLKREKGYKRVSQLRHCRAVRSNIRVEPPKKERFHNSPRLRIRNPWREAYSTGSAIICGICEKVIMDYFDITIDHIVPLSKGGSNHESNLQPAHAKCNWDKGNKLFDSVA